MLRNLRVLRLNENILDGSIPTEIFDSSQIQELMLHRNRLTGSIPAEIGKLKAATSISLSYNSLKGTIPIVFQELSQLKLLHLHFNQLTGIAPNMAFLAMENEGVFIADCGDPSYLLPAPLHCDTCTMCCNSDEKCQETQRIQAHFVLLAMLLLPMLFVIFAYCIRKTPFRVPHTHSIYSADSMYAFILADSWISWLLYFVTAAIQCLLFAIFIESSSFQSEESAWQFTFRCPNNDIKCHDESSVTKYGWLLFFIVTVSYLGSDLVLSVVQLHISIHLLDIRLFISGSFLFILSATALYASTLYNTALAESNPDLIMNAVILLFINDLDEKILSMLYLIAPVWTEDQLIGVEKCILEKIKERSSITPTYEMDNGDSLAISDESPNDKTLYGERKPSVQFQDTLEVISTLSQEDAAVRESEQNFTIPILYSKPSSSGDANYESHILERDLFR